jgi:hypothetical protein
MDVDLLRAAARGRLDIVQDLCSSGANLNVHDNRGSTALMCAVLHDHLDIVQELCRLGADLDVMDQYGKTALMWAVTKGNLHVIRALCDAGANIDCRNDWGDTALTFAVEIAYSGITEPNVKYDAPVDELCRRGARGYRANIPTGNPYRTISVWVSAQRRHPPRTVQGVLTKQTFRHHVLMMLCARVLSVDLLRQLHEYV